MNPEELKSIAVLRAMDAEALARLATALEERTYSEGETVFAEGDAGDSMYFILKGNIRIEKQAATAGAARKDPHRARGRGLFWRNGSPGPEAQVSGGSCRGKRPDSPTLKIGV